MPRQPDTSPGIRVLHIISGADIGNVAGGAESYALRLVEQLDRTKIRPAVFAMRRADTEIERSWLDRLADLDVPVYGLNVLSGSTPSDVQAVARSYRQALSAFGPQIANSHSERGDLLNCMGRTLHPSHPSAVQTVHIDVQWGTRPWFGWPFTHLVAPLCFEAQVAVSDTIRRMLDDKLMARLRGRAAYLCYNGIDASLFDTARSSVSSAVLPAGLPDVHPRIGIVGRLTDQKGHSDALEALALVNRTRPAHLLILGAGPLEAQLKAQAAALGIVDKIHFLGWREDVSAILPHLDLMLSASLWEGFPTVLLEAMAQGVPVIATDVSGSRELVIDGETGLLAPPGEPQRLAECVQQLLNEPALASRLAAAAYEHALQYTMQNTARHYEEIYTGLVSVQ